MEQSRVDEFKEEIHALKIRSSSPNNERTYQILGGILMAVGVALPIISYFVAGAQNSGDPSLDNLEHNELIILSIIGVAVTIAGAAVFLRYSITRFFRFWLLRRIYENRPDA